MPPVAAGAVALAFALDLAIGEPPGRIHPVAWYGRLLAPVDREWAHPQFVGALVALSTVAAAGIVAGVVTLAGGIDPLAGAAAAGLVLFSATSLRMLLDTASGVVAASESDLERARERLRALAGRDASALSPGEVRSAAVESAAENLADGLVGPLFAFAVLAWSPPLAAGAAAWVKAVNTADSMLGYREKPVGRVPARLDDAVMWIPARLSAALVAVAALDPGALSRGRRWARAPPSPNSGWPMATLAAALGVRLEKPGAYALGSGSLPTVERARRGVRIVGRAGALAFLVAGVIAWS